LAVSDGQRGGAGLAKIECSSGEVEESSSRQRVADEYETARALLDDVSDAGPVRALILLMVREVPAIPKVALPVRDTGPLITDVPLSLVIVARFCMTIILFNGTD